MKVVGVITEHNPYHNGHQYHVTKAREETCADYVVSIMSGHFLQRGEPALFNKWARAKAAILGGVDIVIELPTAFSVRSASAFAKGSVAVLDATGVVTDICFGSESGNLAELWPPACLLASETAEFSGLLRTHLSLGMTFPKARAAALTRCLNKNLVDQTTTVGLTTETYAKPNNILGIEYLRALLELKSSIKPIAIKRFAAGYHDTEIGPTCSIASATSIREELLLAGGLTAKIKSVVPDSTFSVMQEELSTGRGPVFLSSCDRLLFYHLRTWSRQQLAELVDVGEGLENRFLWASEKADSVHGLIELVKTKRYTWTRIQRIISYILLGYTKEMAASFDNQGPAYVRVLGMSCRGRTLIKIIKKKASVPVVLRTSPFISDPGVWPMLQFDVKATEIYSLLYPSKEIMPAGQDFTVMPYAGDIP